MVLAVLSSPLLQIVALTVTVVAGAFFGYRKYSRAQRRKGYPKDVVILHQLPPGLRAPSASPFALKLETWLKMAGIKYQNEFGYEFGPKGKIPWITLNGQELGDSQFCIEFLSKKFGVNFSSEHSAEENAAARAFFKMTEESLFWTVVLHRFVYNPSTESSGAPGWLLLLMKRTVRKRTRAQGYGLHSQAELDSIAAADLDSLNAFVGRKRYLLGEKLCDADSAIFGLLAQIECHDRTFLNAHYRDKCPNLVRYVAEIKRTFWPEWNERIKEKQL